ncbi:MAG: LLM class flavin-dependent oxidoreductase [Alphaproteobacteria bacterium]
MAAPLLGINAPWDPPDYAAGLAARKAAGLEMVIVSDHLSFRNGFGQDALIRAGMVHAQQPDLTVLVAVYLLPLRHPALVARQLSDLNQMAPGKLVLGIGVGGEDRAEIAAAGIDPATRGKRTDESLICLRGLMTGAPVEFEGAHFRLDGVKIVPAVEPAVPILVGGRSEAALRRAALHGDGWFGIFCTADRFARSLDQIGEAAAAADRDVDWRHGMQVWCAVDDDVAAARARLSQTMSSFYQVPWEKFERYAPAGTAEQVAEYLAAYVRAGARLINLAPVGDDQACVDGVAKVKEYLEAEFGR